MSWPFALVSTDGMRALEAAAFAAGIPERELQERAGLAVADVVSARLIEPARVIALVGAGNNGRDAVVAGRHLSARGHRVQLHLVPRHAVTDSELAALRSAGIDASILDLDAEQHPRLRADLEACNVAVDGLLGIGARGPMRPGLARVAMLVNTIRAARRELLVVAVDVPSGLDADDGSLPGVVVRADITVTFGAVKRGLLTFPGAGSAGRLEPRPIGLPRDAVDPHPIRILDESVVQSLVPTRPLDAHKYRLGRVLVVAGSDQFVGAACLGAGAAARSGCGLVSVVSAETVKLVLATRLPEATYPIPSLDLEAAPDAAASAVADLLPSYQALLLGPGIGRSVSTERFVRSLLTRNVHAERPVPTVVDADGLNVLSGWERWWEEIGPGHLLTPHAGEMARLAGTNSDAVTASPWDVATECAARWDQAIALKGPFTSIAAPSQRTWVYPRANPALATAGTGDVLAGLCAGLAAQGLGLFDAARLAVVAHALSARRVLARYERRTLVASDLLDEIPSALWDLERGGGHGES
jgi:ADP-dependent NAD(P)H-hydrate dehydratase / NAD(P)H-hydrate epimerase